MSLKEHLPGNSEKPSAEKTLRKALGLVATKYGERLGPPQGKHSRTHDAGPRPDVGEIARNAGFNTISEIPSFPINDKYKVAAPELIDRITHPESKGPVNTLNDDTIPLFSQPDRPAPRGPDYPYILKN